MANKYIGLKPSNCKNCYKCIRNCPVKSIKFANDQANIIEDECVLCGMCFISCPQNAKEIRNDVDKAKQLIASGAPVYASVAPSFVANYNGMTIEAMESVLKKLGFAGAFETAEGAQMVTNIYDKMVDESKQDVIISSCCHSVNLLIQKYFPQALEYLAHVKSPMQAHCEAIKRRYPGAKTVFIGPCISKKDEAEQYKGSVDCVLTFDEFDQWLSGESVKLEDCAEHAEKVRARLYPTSGGILRTMKKQNKNYVYMAVDGMQNVIRTLEDVIAGNIKGCFIEMSACEGSCISGPAMDSTSRRAYVRDFMQVDKYAGAERENVEMPCDDEMKKDMPYIGIRRSMPGNKDIENILRQMGKMKPEDELNCGSCGYNTCRDKARAVFWGKAEITMCLPFLMKKAESFSDTIIGNTPNAIIVLNEDMEIQQINKSACKMMNVKYPKDVIGDPVVRLLDPIDFMEVLDTGRNIHDKSIHLTQYNKYVEQTIIYDKSYHILICIMRDMTDEETEREKKENISRQTVEITDKVIEKQMRIVQEIASLLGETTAETKIALTKLKETLKNE